MKAVTLYCPHIEHDVIEPGAARLKVIFRRVKASEAVASLLSELAFGIHDRPNDLPTSPARFASSGREASL